MNNKKSPSQKMMSDKEFIEHHSAAVYSLMLPSVKNGSFVVLGVDQFGRELLIDPERKRVWILDNN